MDASFRERRFRELLIDELEVASESWVDEPDGPTFYAHVADTLMESGVITDAELDLASQIDAVRTVRENWRNVASAGGEVSNLWAELDEAVTQEGDA